MTPQLPSRPEGRLDHRGRRTLVYVVNELQWFWTHRLPLARAAQAAGWQVSVAAAPSPFEARVREAGFEVHTVRLLRSRGSLRAEWRGFLDLVRLYRRLRPSLVHHVTIKPVLYGSLAARVARVPAVVNAVAGLGYVFMTRSVGATVLRVLIVNGLRVALSIRNSIVIFQNPDDRAAFVGSGIVRPDRTLLVRGAGVDVAHFQPSREPAGIPIVLLAARMLVDKGVADLAAASRLLRERGVACRIVLCGVTDVGNPTSIPEAQLEAWREDGLVERWGQRWDMDRVIADATIVVLPSYREGLPKVLLEAAASGRALVTNDVPGCREVVQHGVNGLLVPAKDVAALADAIEVLLRDPEMRARMGAAGRRIVLEEFTQEAVSEQTVRAYESLVPTQARP